MAPSDHHEHTMVARLRERDRMGWEQCTSCPHRTEEHPVEIHKNESGLTSEWTDDELIALRVQNAIELGAPERAAD